MAAVPSSFTPGDRVHRQPINSDGREHYNVPAGGIIDRIELHSRIDPLWNTDASMPYRLVVDLIAGDGTKVPIDVTLVWREVQTP